MKKINIILILLLIQYIGGQVSATNYLPSKGTDATIFGHVVDKNGEHLPYINVFVKGTTIGTMTDGSGHYFLKDLPERTLTIEVSAIGYTTVRRQVKVVRATTQEINFTLDEDQIALDEVVVSANRSETARRVAPNLVNIVDGKLFERAHAACLAQGLSFQPGVRVEDNCQNCGFTQVRINGLDGHYSQILIDSRPIFSAVNGIYGLEQIPSNMIDRVEIVRGGGSALYGASAIGGTINIITKEPLRNSAAFGHSLTVIGGSHAIDNNSNFNASLVTDNNKAGFYIYGQNRKRDGYDHDGDGYTELPQLNTQTIGLRSYLRLSPYSKISLEYHSIKEFRRGGNKLDLVAHEANIAEQVSHDINGGGLNWDWFAPNGKDKLNIYVSAQNTERNSYYGGTGAGASEEDFEKAEKAYGKTHDITWVGGAQYTHNFSKLLFMPSEFILGTEYNHDKLTDEIIGYEHFLSQKAQIASIYAQNEWKNQIWSFLIGGRVDKHNLLEHAIFSPRVNLRFNPNSNINIRLSYAGGFRAPQTFDEDLHVTMVGGERLVTRLAKDLKEERSHSYSFSTDFYHTFGKVQTNLLLEGFYTDLNNVFEYRNLDAQDEQGNAIHERYNAYGAKVYGLNAEAKAVFSKYFEVQGGITIQKSYFDEPVEWDENAPKEKKMLRTPNVYGYFTATLTPIKRLTANLTGNYTGSMFVGRAGIDEGPELRNPELIKTPSFFDFNLKIAYDIPVYKLLTLQVNAGIQNISNAYQKDFDKSWTRDSGYIYGPQMPRSYYVGFKMSY